MSPVHIRRETYCVAAIYADHPVIYLIPSSINNISVRDYKLWTMDMILNPYKQGFPYNKPIEGSLF